MTAMLTRVEIDPRSPWTRPASQGSYSSNTLQSVGRAGNSIVWQGGARFESADVKFCFLGPGGAFHVSGQLRYSGAVVEIHHVSILTDVSEGASQPSGSRWNDPSLANKMGPAGIREMGRILGAHFYSLGFLHLALADIYRVGGTRVNKGAGASYYGLQFDLGPQGVSGMKSL